MIEIKPLGRKLTAKQIGEFESRDWLGEETWIRYKQELDALLSYRKSFKGKPTDEQLSQLEFNKELIEWYNGILFHSFRLAQSDKCDCVKCEKRRNPNHG